MPYRKANVVLCHKIDVCEMSSQSSASPHIRPATLRGKSTSHYAIPEATLQCPLNSRLSSSQSSNMVSFFPILASTLLLFSKSLANRPRLDAASFHNDAEIDKVRQSYRDAFLLAQTALLHPSPAIFAHYFPAAWQPSADNLFRQFVLAQPGEPVGAPSIEVVTISRADSNEPGCQAVSGCVPAYTRQLQDGHKPEIRICDKFFKVPELSQLSLGESYTPVTWK